MLGYKLNGYQTDRFKYASPFSGLRNSSVLKGRIKGLKKRSALSQALKGLSNDPTPFLRFNYSHTSVGATYLSCELSRQTIIKAFRGP